MLCSLAAPSCTRQVDRSAGPVVRIGESTWQDIDAFDREKTLFLLTLGMLEEHGPHLPIAADTLAVEYEAARIAERLSQSFTGWTIVVMPTLEYGTSGADQLSGKPAHPGTYSLRQSTLRAVIADIGAQIAQNGFKRIYVMSGHGAPTQHAALNEACDFVSETFNVTMVNVSALFMADAGLGSKGEQIAAKHFSPADLASFGNDLHAGVAETSGMLAVRPDLVRSAYQNLPAYPTQSIAQSREIATRPGWPGYFSAPSKASAAYGRKIEDWWIEGVTDLILQSVRGDDLRQRPRWPEPMRADPDYSGVIEGFLMPEREFAQTLQQWLDRRGVK